MKITEEMIEAACKTYDTCIPVSAPPAYPSRMKAAIEAALAAAPARDLEPVPLDAFEAIEAESNQLRELCTQQRHRAEALRKEIDRLRGALLSIAVTCTEDSHGNTKDYPVSWYKAEARKALTIDIR
jgi:hypothetical protein